MANSLFFNNCEEFISDGRGNMIRNPEYKSKSYTIQDAEREISEMIADSESTMYIWIFINDLRRGRDITSEESDKLIHKYLDHRSLETLDSN